MTPAQLLILNRVEASAHAEPAVPTGTVDDLLAMRQMAG